MTRYWLRGSNGYEVAVQVAEDGTACYFDLAYALGAPALGPWTVIDRTGGTVRYLGLIDRSIVSQSGARLCDVHGPNTMRFQLLGQLTPAPAMGS